MALQGTCREINDVAIIDFSGKITLGEGSSTLRRTIKELIDKGHRKIVLNLYDVDYIDSSGIGELVSGYTTVRNAEGELKLLHRRNACTTCCRSPGYSRSSTCSQTKTPRFVASARL